MIVVIHAVARVRFSVLVSEPLTRADCWINLLAGNMVRAYSVSSPHVCSWSKSVFADYPPLFRICRGNVA